MRARLTIGFDGEVGLSPREASELGLAPGDAVEFSSARGAFLLVAPAGRDAGLRAYLAGSLAGLGVAEVVHLIFTSIRSGALVLSTGGGGDRGEARQRTIYFRDGQVVFAASSEPGDRLGPVLWRLGLVAWGAVERCGRLVRPGRPLGQVLVDEGVLTPGQLYAGVAAQVREILLGAMLETEGTFAFVDGPHEESNAVRLQERTRDLLLEGMKRLEEAERLLALVGGRGAVLARTVEPPPGLGEHAARLMLACDGSRPFAAVAGESGLGLLEALRQAAPLLEAGALRPAPPPIPASAPSAAAAPPAPPPPPAAGAGTAGDAAGDAGSATAAPIPEGPTTRSVNPFEIYRRIFRRVHAVLAEGRPGAASRLNTYFDRLHDRQRHVFDGVRIDDRGELDVGRVLDNVVAAGSYRGASARARALEALEDFLTFSLFEVKNVLPRGQAEAVLREVGRMQVGKL